MVMTSFITLCFTIYMILEIANGYSLLFSIFISMNFMLLPVLNFKGDGRSAQQLQDEKEQKSKKLLKYLAVGEMKVDLNHFLIIVQDYKLRKEWMLDVIDSNRIGEKDSKIYKLILGRSREQQFQLSVFTEVKFLYIVEHDKNLILRIFEIDLSKAKTDSFFLKYYYQTESKTFFFMNHF